jgi:hypothetical protein
MQTIEKKTCLINAKEDEKGIAGQARNDRYFAFRMKKKLLFEFTTLSIVAAIIAVVFLHSCTNTQTILLHDQQLLVMPEKVSESISFNKYFELESIIPIETNNESLITVIKKVICCKDKIIILTRDDSNIFIIDAYSGNVETKIDRIGNGPGESKTIMDIAFDEQSDNILVFNDYNKLLYFTLQGDFIRDEKVNDLYENIVCDHGNIFFYNKLDGYGSYPYLVDIYNLKNKNREQIGVNTKVNFPARNYGQQIVKSKKIWFSSPLGFEMYDVNDTIMESPYKLQMAGPPITDELIGLSATDMRSFFKHIRGEGIIYGISSIRETDHFLIFKSNMPGLFFFQKDNLTTYWENVFDKQLGIDLTNYYPHEGNDNRIMFIVQPNEWLKRRITNTDISHELKEKIDSIVVQDDDNPILLFYREK